jgi:rod shape determining protein RodA
MIVLIIIPFLGSEIASTFRWIDVGLPIGFQPSELAKWIVVIALARYLSDHNLEMNYFSVSILPIIIVLVPAAIILTQPDLGTAIIILVPVLPMLYWVGARPFHLFLMVAPLVSILTAFHWMSFSIWAAIMLFIIYKAKPNLVFSISTFFGNVFLGLLSPVLWGILKVYQQKRILTLFNPEIDPLGAAYQIIQSNSYWCRRVVWQRLGARDTNSFKISTGARIRFYHFCYWRGIWFYRNFNFNYFIYTFDLAHFTIGI